MRSITLVISYQSIISPAFVPTGRKPRGLVVVILGDGVVSLSLKKFFFFSKKAVKQRGSKHVL